MAGLVRAIHAVPPPLTRMIECLIQIGPGRIRVQDQPRLPGAGPVLHIRFALDRVDDPLIELHVNETLEAVPLGEALYEAFPVLIGASAKIGRDPSAKNAV